MTYENKSKGNSKQQNKKREDRRCNLKKRKWKRLLKNKDYSGKKFKKFPMKSWIKSKQNKIIKHFWMN